MDRLNYNPMDYPYNGHLGYSDEGRYNGDEYAANNASFSVDYNAPEYPNPLDTFYQARPTYNYRPPSRNTSEFSNGYSGAQNFDRGFARDPTDVVSNLSEDVNPLDERFSEHSFVPSGRNLMMPAIPERSVSRSSIKQPYIDQGDSWAQQQMSFAMNEPSSILNNSYKPQSILNKSHSNNQFAFGSDSKFHKPELAEVIAFLNHQNDSIKANAAAYLQHLSYMDDNVKVQTRVLKGIPPLLTLVDHPHPEVHRAACGALRNLSYGKVNDDNKREIKNSGGITTLVRLIRRTSDQEILELVTGIIWNLSSCTELKKLIIDEGLKILLDQIIGPLSKGLQEQQNNVPSYRSIAFRNASGVLRNVSSDGDYARKKMRECEGLIGSLMFVIRRSLSNDDCDNKSIENCVCVLRNLSYACQEVSDPDYLRKKILNLDNKDSKTGCFGNKSKSTNKQKNSSSGPAPIFDHTKHANSQEMSQLWSPEILNLYLPLLSTCTNPDTLEATAGAIQNLVACDWQPSKDLREVIRKRKGIDIIIMLLRNSPDKVICSSARSLRNLALDDKCRDLIGKHAMKDLVEKLPSPLDPTQNPLSTDTLLAIESTLYEVMKSNSSFAKIFVDVKGVNKLMTISKSPAGMFDEKVVKYARQLLQKIWKYSELHDELKTSGWEQSDFNFSPMSAGTWSRSSAENTINRPIMSQGQSQLESSFRRPTNQNNGDALNQNSLARANSNYSLSRRNDEIPLDALHAMQLNDRYRSSRDQLNDINNPLGNFSLVTNGDTPLDVIRGDARLNNYFDAQDLQQTGYLDQSQTGSVHNGRNPGIYWIPGDSNMSTVRTSNNMQGSTDHFHLGPQPVVPKSDSWV